MSRVQLLSITALGVILAGCSPAPEAKIESTPAANASSAGNSVATTSERNAPANAATNDPAAAASNEGGATADVPAGAAFSGVNLKKLDPMPAFSMVSTKGEKLTNEGLKGKVVILDFWATWCAPCKAASPTMQTLHEKYGKQGLVIIGANAQESNDPAGAAAKYQKEHGYTYSFTPKNDDLALKIGVEGFPCFIFIDKAGKVRNVDMGFSLTSTPEKFETIVKALLAEA